MPSTTGVDSAIQIAFTILRADRHLVIPIEGYLVDRFGRAGWCSAGRILVGIAWVLNSTASSLAVLYFSAAIGGVGTGCVYGLCVGNGSSNGSRAGEVSPPGIMPRASVPVRDHDRTDLEHDSNSSGYEQAFMFFGLLQGGIVFVVSWLLLAPPAQLVGAKVKPNQTARGYTPARYCAVRCLRCSM